MNDERCDRDRVTAILTLAEAATEGPWKSGGDYDGPYIDDDPEPNYWRCWEWDEQLQDVKGLAIVDTVAEPDAAFIAASRSETPWLARRLLEALDTIDKARALHFDNGDGDCVECGWAFPCGTVQELALNGGNDK